MPLVKKLKTCSFTYPVLVLEKNEERVLTRKCSHCSKNYECTRKNLRVENLCTRCK